jgi:hypothetical protein
VNTLTATPVQYAPRLDRAARGARDSFRWSSLGHGEVFEELAEVWEGTRQPGWDGHGALAVEQDTLRCTYMLIESLPLGFPRPTVGAEADGQLTLEWYKSSLRLVSVSIDPSGCLHYAGLYGVGKKYGTLPFFGEAPKELLRLVEEL